VRLVKRVEMLEALASHKGRRLGVLALEVKVPRLNPALQRVVPAIAAQYAHALYAAMRGLDAQNVDLILVERRPPLRRGRRSMIGSCARRAARPRAGRREASAALVRRQLVVARMPGMNEPIPQL